MEARMLEQLETLNKEATAELANVRDGDALHEWEAKYLGGKGAVTTLLRGIGSLPKEERAEFGMQANELKVRLAEVFAEREKLVAERELAKDLEEGQIDVTLPGRARQVGGLHPSTQT